MSDGNTNPQDPNPEPTPEPKPQPGDEGDLLDKFSFEYFSRKHSILTLPELLMLWNYHF